MKEFLFKSNWGRKITVVFVTIAIPAAIILSTLFMEFLVKIYNH